METIPAPETPKPKTSYGTVFGLLIIVAAIVVAAFYFLNERVRTDGTSTEPAAIEQDLEKTSPEEFDKEIDAAFVELDAALEAQ